MLRIRPEQMQIFEDLAFDRFKTGLVPHLRRSFPSKTRALDDAALTAWVAATVTRGQARGFESEADLTRWVELCGLFGTAFDKDPMLPWAGEVLAQAEELPADELMDDLWADGQAHRDRTLPPDTELPLPA